MSESRFEMRHFKESDTARANALKKAQEKYREQRTYIDIPVYPQGYKDPKDKTTVDKQERPMWLPLKSDETPGHDYNSLPLSSDWLPSDPKSGELLNSIYQLECHAHERCAISLQWWESATSNDYANGDQQEGPCINVAASLNEGDGDAEDAKADRVSDVEGVAAAEFVVEAAVVTTKDATDARYATADGGGGAANCGGSAPSNGGGKKKDFLSLPSFRVKPQNTPSTSYPKFTEAQVQGKETKRDLAKREKEQRNNTFLDKQAQEREDKRAAAKISRKPLKDHQRRKNDNKQDKDQENQLVDNEDLSEHSEHMLMDNTEQNKYQKLDSYHIIRFKDRRIDKEKPFVDFLRQDSSGYILAFRAFAELSDAKDAYWCCFEDAYAELCSHLPFFRFKRINFGSGYFMVSEVVFGKDTIEKILDAIYECYSNPATYMDDAMDLLRHILFVLFGEGPRFEAVRAKIFCTIDETAHANCPQFGAILDKLVHNWSNVCCTIFHLLLMLLEEELANKLIEDRLSETQDTPHHSQALLFAQLDSHWLIAQKRCAGIGNMPFQKLLQLTKESDDTYGRIAFKQLIGDYVPFLLYLPDICEAIIMRRDFDYKKMILPLLTSCGTDKEFNVDADSDFWLDFMSYRESKNQSRKSVLKILVSSLPVLDRYGFSYIDAELHEEVRSACLLFESTLCSNRTETIDKAEQAAVNAVKVMNPSFFSTKLKSVMDFLWSHKPILHGSEINRSVRKAKLLQQGGVA